MNNLHLSIVIPAYNEAARIGATLQSIERYFGQRSVSYEVIVVDDGSNDETVAVAQAYASHLQGLRVLSGERNRGKGFAVRRGMCAATGNLRLFMDADNSVDIAHLDEFEGAIEAGADVVIGSIHISDHVSENNGWHRRILGSCANVLIQALAVWGIKDTQRGFKLFTAKAASDVFGIIRVDGFGFDIEALIVARRCGYVIKELPVTWDNPAGSKVTALSYLETLRDLLVIFKNRVAGRYSFRLRVKEFEELKI